MSCQSVSHFVLDNVHISDNLATHAGGGLYHSSCNVTIGNRSSLTNNNAVYGGGIYSSSSYSTLSIAESSVVMDNNATYGGGVYCNWNVLLIIEHSLITVQGMEEELTVISVMPLYIIACSV